MLLLPYWTSETDILGVKHGATTMYVVVLKPHV
jgi:hypothetical protein